MRSVFVIVCNLMRIKTKKIERGLRLYEQHNQNAAVKMWRSALKSTSKRNDRFQLLGYLYQGHMDFGKYRYENNNNITIKLPIT